MNCYRNLIPPIETKLILLEYKIPFTRDEIAKYFIFFTRLPTQK